MTRSEAIDMLRQICSYLTAGNPVWRTEPIREACDMAIEALAEKEASAEPRWIPVTDAEPQESGDYLLYRPHFWGANKGQITVCYWNGHEWSDNYKNDAERFLPKVYGMAWMPLPKPWKGVDDD